ncbi:MULTISPECIES: inner membrane protein YiaB [Kluyvera]|uniref:inner membrane protein YiaB n=1 Tax=Kluyvera sp. CHPC 1.2972 TaxID=2995176 RepID=UPI002FD7D09A
MKRSALIAWLFMLVGALIYLIGLWQACPLLSGKGYFLGVLITSMFIIYVYQREVKRGLLDDRFAAVCQMVALMTSGLLLVGLWNAPLSLAEKVVYLFAFCLCLLGQVMLTGASNEMTAQRNE